MGNTMLKGRMGNNLTQQIKQFADNINRSGKSPETMLNEILASGKFTKEQIEQAKTMARLFAGKI